MSKVHQPHIQQGHICVSGEPTNYHIAGFFEDKNFHKLAFPRFSRGKFSRIVTDCKEYLLKSKHFKGKIFTNRFRFVKFTKIFPIENNPLYGTTVI